MKALLTLTAFLPFACIAQTTWDVEVGGSLLDPNNLPYYDPMELVIDVGDIVRWTNISGSHNVFGQLSTFPDNPEGFGNNANPVSAPWVWSHTFTIPGVYDYECTGSFQGQFHSTTQFGTITVVDPSSVKEESPWGGVKLYPVPANETLNVSTGTSDPLRMELIAPDGRSVHKSAGTGLMTLDLSGLPDGLYLLRLSDAKGRLFSRPFVKG